ncbi:MAG TPA: hypothetical protein PLY87_02580 [Planctomycetaceae bacterium]|nr:hypothetical protein [Planctomycetaceae bacterium]HQZ63929.1 hypothetical protein [Planctomycetaceae bacterium]
MTDDEIQFDSGAISNVCRSADEMEAKPRVYQQARVRMIWYINPKSCDAVCHRSAGESTYIARDGVLYGENVLPDFQLSVSELFARADQQRPAKE